MAYEEKNRPAEIPHNIILEGRARLLVSGVEDIDSFDDREIILRTPKGILVVRGSELHLEKLSLDSGEVAVEGTIDSMEYEEDTKAPEGGFLSRLFR